MKTITSLLLLFTVTLLLTVLPAWAQQTTAFTYQGQLRDGGTNANGAYTMTFKLYDAASGGGQIGSTITSSPVLANGLFSVNLNFGTGAFNGNARWLDITAQSGTDAPESLTPRVQVLPAPYALYAAVAATVTNGAIMNAQLSGGAVNSTNIADGQVIKSLNGLSDAVTLSAHSNIYLSTNGNEIAIAADLNNIEVDKFSVEALNDAPNGIGLRSGNSSLIMQSGYITLDATGSGGPPHAIQMSPDNNVWIADLSVGNLHGNLSAPQNLTVGGDLFVAGLIYGTLNEPSDRSLKENFATIDNQDILERVADLPISQWNFKTDAATRHIGPMAQDFYAAFNVGTDEKHIATVDESGVALAAIQGLNEKLKEKDSQIKSLEKRLAYLEKLVKPSAHTETGNRR